MIATFVIFLREGIEASMIVAILLAYLDQLGKRDHFRDVALGVGAALLLAAGGGTAAYLSLKTWAGSRDQTIFETITYLLAAVVLTYMTFWMRNHTHRMSAELRARTSAALDGRARWSMAAIAFQAVGREGLETAVFTLAIVFASTGRGVSVNSGRGVLIGAGAGIVVALGIAYAIYRLGSRLNIAVFFKVVGALLMAFAAGILVDAVQNMQQLGWITVLTHPMWNTARFLSENSTLGDIFHSFFGYAESPSVMQGAVYVVYLVTAVGVFFGLQPHVRGRSTRSVSAAPPHAA